MASYGHQKGSVAYPMLNETGPRSQHFRGLTLGEDRVASDRVAFACLPHFPLSGEQARSPRTALTSLCAVTRSIRQL